MNDESLWEASPEVIGGAAPERGKPGSDAKLPDPIRERFEQQLPFALDPFQLQALDYLDSGASVVVAAPTGSGKTVVAEYAVHRAIAEGTKAFYTAPIKALSNQKFNDLVATHGADKVGLLTGDNSINDGAPVLVMTTEVLRNMIYARSSTLEGLRYVVLDEVHYLQDAYRGPVWEEVIIHTPPEVDLVCLSATVSNASELADWVSSVRGRTEVVIHQERPIELVHLYLVGNRETGDVGVYPTFVDGRPNPQCMKFDADTQPQGPRSNRRNTTSTPKRADIIDAFRQEDMLPAIYFIFSRAACDDAVTACLASGLRLTSPIERTQIRAIVEEKLSGLSEDDRSALDVPRFLRALDNGFSAHHAGMVPPLKEAVEACFVEGLVKVVFATETLALGINMPARSVVIEKLSKFGGERHQFLTAGEFTQLTGRAGRRGIDPIGYAATLWTPFLDFEQVATLAAMRTYELHSSFRPTFNMAVNLVRRYSPVQAHHLLSLSFAQYQIDGEMVSTKKRIHRLEHERDEATAQAQCELGDVAGFLRSQRKREQYVRPASNEEILYSLENLQPGDILQPPALGEDGQPEEGSRPSESWLVVISTARRRGRDPQLRAIGRNGKVFALTARDFRVVPIVATNVRLPHPFNPTSRSFQKAAQGALLKHVQSRRPKAGSRHAYKVVQPEDESPVKRCPDLGQHIQALQRVDRLTEEINRLDRLATDKGTSLADQFDRILQILERLGYLDGWALSPKGEVLVGIYHESDLLLAQCLNEGIFDNLTPAQFAALLSAFVYEQRGPGSAANKRTRGQGAERERAKPGHRDRKRADRPNEVPIGFPRSLTGRWWSMLDISDDLTEEESDHGLPLTKPLDPGFVASTLQWANDGSLEDVLAEAECTAGDFVRTMKMLMDLLRQVGQIAPDETTRSTARSAADLLFRGVVAVSSSLAGADQT